MKAQSRCDLLLLNLQSGGDGLRGGQWGGRFGVVCGGWVGRQATARLAPCGVGLGGWVGGGVGAVAVAADDHVGFELVSELLEKVGVHGELVIQLGVDHVTKVVRVRWSYSIPRSIAISCSSSIAENRRCSDARASRDEGWTGLQSWWLISQGCQRCLEGLMLLWSSRGSTWHH